VRNSKPRVGLGSLRGGVGIAPIPQITRSCHDAGICVDASRAASLESFTLCLPGFVTRTWVVGCPAGRMSSHRRRRYVWLPYSVWERRWTPSVEQSLHCGVFP